MIINFLVLSSCVRGFDAEFLQNSNMFCLKVSLGKAGYFNHFNSLSILLKGRGRGDGGFMRQSSFEDSRNDTGFARDPRRQSWEEGRYSEFYVYIL